MTPAGKVPGTGLLPLSILFEERFGGSSDPAILQTILALLPALFGDYPQHSDIAPAGLFVAIFSILALAFFYIFAKDYSRGHRFWVFFGLGWYCVLKVLGFGLRIYWAGNTLRVRAGIASTVFLFVSVVSINMLNMLFGHRIFTWRHPETGNASWFNINMSVLYVIVLGVIAMGVTGQCIPTVYFLGQAALDKCHKVIQAAAILQTLYALAGLSLIALAYSIKPGRIDHHFGKVHKTKDVLPNTFSATWIESCNIFYFPRKGSQHILHRGDPQATYIRVMPSNTPPAGGLAEHNDDHHHGPKISTAITLIIVTSLMLTIVSAFRCASTFIITTRGGANGVPFSNWVFRNWVMYLFNGAFEVIVCVLFLVFRADLRFYIPDMSVGRGSSADRTAESFGSDLAVNRTVNTMVPDNMEKVDTAHVN